jgi:molybdopterin adenylyltransferase
LNAAILTMSDKGAEGLRTDSSGPALERWLSVQGVSTIKYKMIPDDIENIAATLEEWSDSGRIDLILTTGGTGVSPRDVTPDATIKVLERLIPGFGEVMRMKSLEKTPNAMISRAIAGIRERHSSLTCPEARKVQ